MNNPNFKKNDDIRKQNRIVYIILASSLAVLAILISLSVISSRKGTDKTESPEKKVTENVFETEMPTEMPTDMPETESSVQDAAESETDGVDAGAEAEDVLPDFFPACAGCVIKEFSDTVPVYSRTMEDYRTHSGVDIAAPVGSDVYAAATGTVGAVWEDPMNGCSITLIHKGGAVSTYSNLSRESIDALKPGMSIQGGDVLATVGDTSLVEIADESHIHYELAIDGVTVNPAEYIDFSDNAENYEE